MKAYFGFIFTYILNGDTIQHVHRFDLPILGLLLIFRFDFRFVAMTAMQLQVWHVYVNMYAVTHKTGKC